LTSPRIVTIGVYGWDLPSYLQALETDGVRVLFDVRQRRGVRGREHTGGNSHPHQQALAQAGIEYQHHPELAPTTELRHLQYAEDARQGVGKRSRVELAPEYTRRYTQEILDPAGVEHLARELPRDGAGALFCVERDPEACHRSLIAARLAAEHEVSVTHLRP
jgi:uncharacterized protein (DUF488 family)